MKQFLKQCSKCRKRKWNSEFNKDKNCSDGLFTQCKECRNISGRKYDLKSRYKITEKDYELMLKSQNRICLICDQPETVKLNGDIRQLCVDHNHRTGKVRGLLCSSCNVMLGKAKDDPKILQKGANYIEQHA